MSDTGEANGKPKAAKKAKRLPPKRSRKGHDYRTWLAASLERLDKKGSELRALREKLELSAEKAGARAGVSGQIILQSERHVPRTIAGLMAYAKAIGQPVHVTVGEGARKVVLL